MSFNCKRLVCVLIALVMVICMTSVVAFAEGSEDVSQEESMTENSAVTENNGETIFEIIENGEGTFMERLAHGGKVTLVGMLVVFAVLIVLMIVLYVFQQMRLFRKQKLHGSGEIDLGVTARDRTEKGGLITAHGGISDRLLIGEAADLGITF